MALLGDTGDLPLTKKVSADQSEASILTIDQSQDVKRGVSCRPGQLGVPSEFVFCPAPSSQGCDNSNRQERIS